MITYCCQYSVTINLQSRIGLQLIHKISKFIAAKGKDKRLNISKATLPVTVFIKGTTLCWVLQGNKEQNL
jgi:hypothetical protein